MHRTTGPSSSTPWPRWTTWSLTGDIHAFFAGTPFSWSGATEGNRVVEFVTSSVSSSVYEDGSLSGRFSQERFRVLAGSRDQYRDFDGVWMRWDPPTRTWARI